MKLVVIESPLCGRPPERCPTFLRPLVERVLRERNRHFAFACMRFELAKGNAPYASHVTFDQPGLLEDSKPEQRALGIAVGQAWSAVGNSRSFFETRGMSGGMLLGEANAKAAGQARHYWFHVDGYRPLALWRCALAAVLRWMLAGVYR